jgi:hypothetical protein
VGGFGNVLDKPLSIDDAFEKYARVHTHLYPVHFTDFLKAVYRQLQIQETSED